MRIPFLAAALSLMVTGMAFGLDIPNISTWTQSTGVGGGGPGRGDVLLAALYDVRDITDPNLPGDFGTEVQIQQTLFSIVNTDPAYGVLARLRFREYKRSHECLDIDIPLSSNDVWVGEIDNINGFPTLFTDDYWVSNAPYSGNDPPTTESPFYATPLSTDFPNGLRFLHFGIVPSVWNEPGLPFDTALARCRYGYIEVIGEERFVSNAKPVFPNTWTINRIGTLGIAPCDGANANNFLCRDVHDTLIGNVYILRPEQVISHQYNMNALSDFAVNSRGIWASTGTPQPNLQDDVQGEGPPRNNPGIGGINQLEAILSKRFVFFQYVNDAPGGTPMSTSVVVTFPTKWFHYQNGAGNFAAVVGWPFLPPFTGTHETPDDNASTGGEVCNVKIFDRDEHVFSVPGTTPISPGQELQPGLPKCPWEVNVFGVIPIDPAPVNFRNNVAIATANNTTQQVFTSGWGWIDFSPNIDFVGTDPRTITQGESGISFSFYNNFFGAGPVPAGQVAANCGTVAAPAPCPGAYRGLPAIGIVMTEFFNDSLEGYYGNTVPWQYSVDFGGVPCTTLAGCAAAPDGSGLPPNGVIFPVFPYGSGF